MDNSDDGQPFPDNAPFRHPTVIAHLSLMTISFLACYPLALIQGARRHRRYHLYTLAGGILVALVGYVAAWSSSFSSQQPLHIVLSILGYILFVLVLGHIGLTVYNFYYGGGKQQQLVNNNKETWWMRFILPLEESVHLVIGWIVVLTGYAYLVIAIIVFTGTCSSSIEQCLMPLAIGSGFLGYGTLVLLHLVNVLNLPRGSTPEYYEALVLTLWGVVCLVVSGVPVLGSEWRAINIGLLWFTGGLFSIAISMQTWMVALRERNIVNTLILCLTGRAVIVGRAQDDAFTSEVHVMLGYLLITASAFRFIQIIFRKTPTDNLPQLLARTSAMDHDDFSDEHDDDTRRANDYQSAYRQLTGQPPACKHTWLFASITIVSGMLTAFLAIASGILFMGANVDWTSHMRYYLNDPSTYVNAIIAVAFLWASYIFVLCTIYNNIRPMSSSYYEYLGLSTIETISTGATCSSPTSTVVDDQHTTSAQQYEEQRFNNLHRSKSLPARRGIEEPPTMRPSQYRAKRRSLLLQSPQQDSNGKKQQQRARSASTVNGVGGVLPDDLDTAYMSRRSWLSNGSATSTGTNGSFGSASSSATTSPPLPNSAPPPMDLTTTTTTASSSSHPHRRTVLFSDEPAGMAGTHDDEHYIRKTESGRRKERVKKQLGHDPTTTDVDVSSSESQHSVAKYYSSERNSSDSNVCE